MYDLLDPKWAGRIAMAKPVAGTTATHVACLFAVLGPDKAADYLLGLRRNDVRIESGNKSCAENVGRGALAVAWTDTDDAMIELAAGRPCAIVYPDSAPDAIGTLFIPNTLAAIAGSPHPAEADRLIDYLLSPEVEETLARGPSAQIPLNRRSAGVSPLPGAPGTTKPMHVDFDSAATHGPEAQSFDNSELLR
jgi:iron(III) transport system substrate-binding protein